MKRDDISFIAKRDNVILNYGSFLFTTCGAEKALYISQKMRNLARLVLNCRENSKYHDCYLENLLKSEKFDDLVDSTNEISGYDSKSDKPRFTVPRLALKIGYALKKCATLQCGVAIRKKDKNMVEDLKFFNELVSPERSLKISLTALRRLSVNNFNKVEILPVTEDLLLVKTKLLEEIESNTKKLSNSPTIEIWRKLAVEFVSRIIIFNKRRSSETAKIKIEQYLKRPKWDEGRLQEVSSSLQPLEWQLCKR